MVPGVTAPGVTAPGPTGDGPRQPPPEDRRDVTGEARGAPKAGQVPTMAVPCPAAITAAPCPATTADAANLAALHAAVFTGPAAWGADAMRLMLAMPGAFGLWLPGQGLVLARAIAGEAEILTLMVVPSAQRQGVGTRLLTAAMARAAANGARAMVLEVAAGNLAALALYRGIGFDQVGRRRRYYADGADALVLRRALPLA